MGMATEPTARIGIEDLQARIRGKRLGIVMTSSALTNEGEYLLDVMHFQWKADIVRLFAMEHGLRGELQAGVHVEDHIDPMTGIPVVSLFGRNRKPDPAKFSDLDAIVFCAQDSGIRYWTFTTHMGYCMEAARQASVEVIVVDRPNPIGGDVVEGCVMEPQQASILCEYPIPLRHGMTSGELAQLFNRKYKVGCELTVIPLKGWRRERWFDETGQLWVPPGPNIPTLGSLMGYAATGLLQSTNVSEGRGTTRSFETFGAPWIDGKNLSEEVNRLGIPGLYCLYRYFCPTFNKYKDVVCSGVLLHVTDRKAFRPYTAAIHILAILYRDYCGKFEVTDPGFFDNRAGTSSLRERLLSGWSAESILDDWSRQAREFEKERTEYLLYE